MADIMSWLTRHGLEKFAPLFAQHEIDFDTLRAAHRKRCQGTRACPWARGGSCW